MENYDQERPRPRVKLSTIIFLGVQAVLIILVVLSVSKFLQNDEIENAPGQGLSAKIINATDAIPADYSGWTEIIEWALLDTILENIDDSVLSKNEASASFRDGSIKTRRFENYGVNYVRAIVDIPSLEQSYEIFLEYPDNKDAISAVEYSESNVAKPYSILCLDDNSEKIYSNFDCHESSDYYTRQKIVANTLGYFYFDYFSAYLDPNGPGTVIISPSVTYDNDDATKTQYIEEVKTTIKTLGISPDLFTYYVRTAADVNYRN